MEVWCFYSKWLPNILLCLLLTSDVIVSRYSVLCDDSYRMNEYITLSISVNYSYKVDPMSGDQTEILKNNERIKTMERHTAYPNIKKAVVIHVRSADNKTDGCSAPVNIPPRTAQWVALVQDGGSCSDQEKAKNLKAKNATAAVVYHTSDSNNRETKVYDLVTVFISRAKGQRIASLVDNGTRVMMNISVGMQGPGNYSSINKTSVLFVSISFIVLMIISLAWLVFYYIQRFRYAHAKERLSKRLMNAAKKAITKMPTRTIKNGDIETDSDFDQCAVCIESYRPSDVIRILPCKHMFHKSCVDPWLIEQRSCPMCKLDILKAYGLQIHGSHDSIVNIDMEGPSTSIGPSELLPTETSRGDYVAPLEVIRYQPAQVEYHDAPPSLSSDGEEEGAEREAEPADESTGLVSGKDGPSSDDSNCSVSDVCELDALMARQAACDEPTPS